MSQFGEPHRYSLTLNDATNIPDSGTHRAWRLGGRNTGSSYQSFVSGFATTAHDRVAIQFVSGNIVTAELTARLTDGTVNTYQGIYFVHDGVITRFNVHQIGSRAGRGVPAPVGGDSLGVPFGAVR
jgi:hypothetical protein